MVSDSLRPHGSFCPWSFTGKNTGVGCHSLLQAIFLTQSSNPPLLCLLHWQVDYLPLVPPEKPYIICVCVCVCVCVHTNIHTRKYCCSVSKLSDFLQPHGLWHTRPPSPSPSPRVCPTPSPLSQWYHPNISSSSTLFSFFLQYFPASGSFPISQLLASIAYYSAIKKNEIMPFIATWMEIELVRLSKSEREGCILYDISYMWNLKYDTNEPTYEIKADS